MNPKILAYVGAAAALILGVVKFIQGDAAGGSALVMGALGTLGASHSGPIVGQLRR